MWELKFKKYIFLSFLLCFSSFSNGKTIDECVGSNILTGSLGFLSGVATAELVDWLKEAVKHKPELENIIKDFEVCEMLDSFQVKSLHDLIVLDPNRPIARCFKYDPYNKKHATSQDEELINVNTMIEKMFSGNYVLSDGKLFFDNFSDIVTVLKHLEKLYNLNQN